MHEDMKSNSKKQQKQQQITLYIEPNTYASVSVERFTR